MSVCEDWAPEYLVGWSKYRSPLTIKSWETVWTNWNNFQKSLRISNHSHWQKHDSQKVWNQESNFDKSLIFLRRPSVGVRSLEHRCTYECTCACMYVRSVHKLNWIVVEKTNIFDGKPMTTLVFKQRKKKKCTLCDLKIVRQVQYGMSCVFQFHPCLRFAMGISMNRTYCTYTSQAGVVLPRKFLQKNMQNFRTLGLRVHNRTVQNSGPNLDGAEGRKLFSSSYFLICPQLFLGNGWQHRKERGKIRKWKKTLLKKKAMKKRDVKTN